MGGSESRLFSTVTQSTFDSDRYSGMWYEVYNTKDESRCDAKISFHFNTGNVVNITTYCVVNNKLANQEQHTAVAPNPYDPCKFVLRTQGAIGGTRNYWIYYTDYKSYAIVGSGVPNSAGNGSDFFVISRTPSLPDSMLEEIERKVRSYGLSQGVA